MQSDDPSLLFELEPLDPRAILNGYIRQATYATRDGRLEERPAHG
jgi:hypothetical protein